ncbi:MAG: DNA primase, partial [Deltaproteobacteria bacterium]|nr:DNA primase [Deltaproteobacteria bacterium]
MGVAGEHLSEVRRIEIAEGLFKVTSRDSSKGELHGLCPIHGEKNPSFSYNYKSDLYNCLSCGAKGDLAGLWIEVKGLDIKEGFKEFCRANGIEVKGEPKNPPRGRTGDRRAADKVIAKTEWQKLKPLPELWIKKKKKKRGWSPE